MAWDTERRGLAGKIGDALFSKEALTPVWGMGIGHGVAIGSEKQLLLKWRQQDTLPKLIAAQAFTIAQNSRSPTDKKLSE